MSDMGYTKNVGMIGSISLLVCSITGPGMVMIPLVFQQSGWVIPIAVFFTVGLLCGLASLFVVEAVSRFPGNEGFSVFIVNDREM
jgi:amino acid permease